MDAPSLLRNQNEKAFKIVERRVKFVEKSIVKKFNRLAMENVPSMLENFRRHASNHSEISNR
jgi:hypothetical protein